MIDQQTAPLTMVSVPADPMPFVCSTPEKAKSFHIIRWIQRGGWIALLILLTITCTFTVNHYFLRSVKVVGVSMVPTLQPDGHYLLNVWALHQRDPQHNDIVVLRDPQDHELAVKRVIATSGESVHFKNGYVYVNGKQLDESYLEPDVRTFTYSQAKEQFITCGKGQYFVMGDNRPRSIDSRAYGTVSREDIYGLVEK